MSFDDGILVNGYYYYAYDNLMATMFTPTNYPVTIDSVMVHVLTEGDQWWPWPDGSHDPVGISVYLDDGSGNPLPDPAFYTEVTLEVPGEWIRVDIEEVLVDLGSFWVAMNNLAGGGEDGMGVDAYTDYPANKWAREGGTWMLQDYYMGDHMIRAKVFGLTLAGQWMGYDAAPSGTVLADVPIGGNPSLVAGSGTANKAARASDSRDLNRMVYHPRVSPINPPMTLNEMVVGYRLYRSTSPNPYNGGVGNLVNNPDMPGGLIITTNYDDWVRWNGTDSIDNGTPYYYEASAVYLIVDSLGHDVYLEQGPSNQDTATATNLPPAKADDLVGSSVGNDVYLNWSPSPSYDMKLPPANYQVWRRLYNAQDWVLVGTVPAPDTFYHEVVMIEGIHRYKILAVDDEGLASAQYSNSVDIPIGAIPPRGMRASTDEEFQISLRWSHPGGGSGGDMSVMLIAADFCSQFQSELGSFEDVTDFEYFDPRNGNPTLDQLLLHNVAVVWSNYPFMDPTGLGDVLADYVDAGGGVVLLQFSFGSGWNLMGRIMDEYSPFAPGPTSYMDKSLGDFDPSHPIMEGVTTVSEYFSAAVSMDNEGTLVASFTDGTPFVGVREEGSVACVNGYIGDDRLFQGDMILVVHNAMSWTTGGAEVIPQSYNLWKASSQSGPFSLLHTQPGTDPPRYVDAPVPNAVPYWYYVTAVYAGPDESDPSDTAQGIAMNYPPSAPFNLTGVPDSREVLLDWSFTDIMGDWDHFNVWKKLVPGGTFALDGSTTDSAYVDTIPIGEDGVWAYVVRAVDDGSPQLESGNSNQVFVPVGNLPPNNLRATSGHEFVVPLHWSEPGMRPTVTIAYDDGFLENAYYYYAYDNLMANQFVTSGAPEVETLWVHVLTEGDPYWPWPDGSPDPIGLSVYDDDGTGFPQPDPAFYIEVTGELGQWISVPIEGGLQLTGPSFWIAMNNLAGGGEEGIGLDLTTDFPQYKWVREFGTWMVSNMYEGDHMVRATIIDNGRLLTLGGDTPTTELALRNQQLSVEPGVVAVTSGARPGTKADIANLRVPQYGDYPRPLDTELLLGYNLYRDLTPGFPIGPGNRIRTYLQQGLLTAYDDSAVVNGTTYYYKVTAQYDNDGSLEESPISNEAMGTPTNNPPLAPYNLAGTVNDRTVNLTWAFYDSVGDWDHFNVYKQQMPGGTRTFVGSTTNYSYSFNIPTGEDGIYRIDVTAVDDGTPQIEGPPSEEIFLPVGHLPPGNLVAVSNYDSKVPLRWMLPGAWRTLSGGSDAVTPQPTPRAPDPLDMSHKRETEPHNPPMLLGRGGPDAFGYEWVDSDEPDGPSYNWRDITGNGTQIPMQYDDQNLGPYDIGFDFEFYGVTFTQFFVCSNGWLSFTSMSGYYFNYPLPDFNAPENMVAPWWDDLNGGGGGEYWYRSDGNELVVSFINVPHLYNGGVYTFQAVLRSSGNIIFNYDTMYPPLNDATIGIQNGDYSIGLTVVYNADYMHDLMAIRLASSPEGFPPVHYNLYRATSPGVPIDPAHLITGNIPGTETQYTDSGSVNNGTTYYYKLTAVWPDSIASPPSNEASATPVMGARLAVNPTTISHSMEPGVVDSSTLQIINSGGLLLNYTIQASVDQRALLAGLKPTKENAIQSDTQHKSRPKQPKGHVNSDPPNPPMLLGRGGPDDYGYMWIDSDEPGGPSYQWVDIVGRGYDVYMWDDDNQGPFSIGFDFPFYGNLFNSVQICSNGWISFTSWSTELWPYYLPDPWAPENLIAPFWNDLDPSSGGQILYYSAPDSFVVSWIDVPHYFSGGPYSFQIVLTPNGRFQFNYLTVNYPDAEQGIGIQNSDATIGLMVAYNQVYAYGGLSVMFTTGWLSTSPTVGAVPGGNTANVNVIYDATLLDEGTYTGSLLVTGWDYLHPVGQITVPVTLTVGPSGCVYTPGDINGVPPANGIDVTFGVLYFKGGNVPPIDCGDPVGPCPQASPFYAALDVNGSCTTNGIDITYFVAYLKGGSPLRWCPTCPPATGAAVPTIMPTLKSSSKVGASLQE
jgi:hypothetical protein